MIERMRGEPFSPHDSSWAHPRDDLANTTMAAHTASSREPVQPGTTRESRHKTERAAAAPLLRQTYVPRAQVHAPATRSQRVSAPAPACLDPPPARRLPHLMQTRCRRRPQRVDREPKHYAVHGWYHRLGDARWCNKRVLETRGDGRATGWVCALRERVQAYCTVTRLV
jgi:hypothetical protein